MGNLKTRARESSFPFLRSFVPRRFSTLSNLVRVGFRRASQGDEYSLEGNNDRGGFGLRA